MSDRHQELLRQRALVQEHLAWLDREIAQAAGTPSTPAAAPTPRLAVPPSGYLASQAAAIARNASVPPRPASTASDDNPATAAAADAILSEYRVAPDTLKTDIRKGCLLYFVSALALVAVGVTVLYLFFTRGR